MQFLKASEVTATTTNGIPHQFATAIIQKKSPGVYVYEFGKGKLDIESVVSFFLARCENVTAIMDEIDKLSMTLRNITTLRLIFDGIFPKKSQTLSEGFTITTAPDVQRVIVRALGDNSTPGMVAVLQEIILEMFADQRFVLPSKGIAYREFRPERIPSYTELAKDCVRNELIGLINETKLRIKLDAFKFTPTSLMAEYERILSDLGRKVAQIGYTLNYFNDALYCVKCFFALGSARDLVAQLSQAVLQSTEFNDLIVNTTVVEMALNPDNSVPDAVTTHHTLLESVKEATKMLSLSTRYQVVTLMTAIAPYRYTPVKDERSNLMGGVLSYSVKFQHQITVGMFDEIPELLNATQATVLNRETDDLTSVVSPLIGKDLLAPVHTGCVHLMSAIVADENEEDRSVLAVVDLLSPADLAHIAAAYADTTYIIPGYTKEGEAKQPELVYSKDLKKKRLMSESLPFEGVIYTADPATIIIACDEFEAEIPLDMSTQDVPIETWDKFILNTTSLPLQKKYNTPKNIVIEIGAEPLSIAIDIPSLLRHNNRNCAGVVYNPISAKVYSAAVDAILDMFHYVLSTTPEGGEHDKINIGLGMQSCHMLSSLVVSHLSSSMFEGMVEDIVRRFVRKSSKRQKDLTYKSLHRANYRRQIEVMLAFVILTRLNILQHPDDSTMSASDVENRVGEFLVAHSYFDMLIGSEFAQLPI